MHDVLRSYLDVLSERMLRDEEFSHEFAELAYAAETAGRLVEAKGFQSISRLHQVKAIEAQAQIGAILHRYAYIIAGL